MKKILVPTDFSTCAGSALKYALGLAQKIEAEITVLHVIFPNDGINNNLYDAFWIDDYVTQRNRDLKEWSSQIKADLGNPEVKVHYACSIGFPVGVIADTASEMGATFVVMGTMGATGLKGILLGSTAGGVIAQAKIPVFTVPAGATFGPKADFVLATDFNMRTDKKSHKALELVLQAHGAKLTLLHVLKEGENPQPDREQAISSQLEGIDHHFRYIHDNDVPNAVDNFIESTNAGGLIAVAHNHSLLHQLFYRSVSRAMAGRVQVPMLSLHYAQK